MSSPSLSMSTSSRVSKVIEYLQNLWQRREFAMALGLGNLKARNASTSLGLRRVDVDALLDDVVEFGGLGHAIDRPVKTYSSGMCSRLAFSVSMHVDPDILLLDEVLAVGDSEFREKSMRTMRELVARAGTIVFVSHSLPQVADFCSRAMWLARGRVQMVGPAAKVVDAYRANAVDGSAF